MSLHNPRSQTFLGGTPRERWTAGNAWAVAAQHEDPEFMTTGVYADTVVLSFDFYSRTVLPDIVLLPEEMTPQR